MSTPVPASSRLEHFDGLRAIAALSVFGLHGIYQIAVAQPGAGGWWFRWGVHLDVGVSIFFAISGFLLYRPFLRATLNRTPVDVGAYAWRRLVRIVPAYWVALAVIAVWFSLDEVLSVTGALRFGGFAQVYSSDTALQGMGQAWSLCVEMAFYVLLPLFALVVCRARTLRTAAIGCLGFVVVGILWKAFALGVTDAARPGSAAWLYTLPAHMDALGGGMLLAVGAAAARPPRVVAALAARPGLTWGLALAVFLVIGLLADGGTRSGVTITDPQYLVTRTLYAVVATLIVLPAVFTGDGRGWPRRFLRSRPMALMGLVSYSFYLWHYAAIGQVARWWDGAPTGLTWIPWTLACLGFALVLSVASYRLIEKPFMWLRTLVPGRRRAATVDAVQAAP